MSNHHLVYCQAINIVVSLALISGVSLAGGMALRDRLLTINQKTIRSAKNCAVLLLWLGACILAYPVSANADALLIDMAEMFRGLSKSPKIRVIVNLADPGPRDMGNAEGRMMRRQSVRSLQDSVFAGLNAKHLKLTRRFDYHSGFAAEVTREGLEELRMHGVVVSIEPDRVVQIHTKQGIPLMSASGVRSTYGGQGVAIAIVDTGIDYTHPNLSGKVLGGYNFGDDTADPMDLYGHGTSCAGIAAGNDDSTGDYIGGVADSAKLYAVKVTYGSAGWAYESSMIAGWEWCITHQNDNPDYPIMIINTSMGGGGYTASCDDDTPAMTDAAANANTAGITIFASSGNNGYCNAIAWPACISHVIAVGAVFDASLGTMGYCVDPSSCAPNQSTYASCGSNPIAWSYSTVADRETPYSNTASILGLFAPADIATTITKGGSYANFSGTSAASPYAAGAAAVLQNAAKAKTGSFLLPEQVRSILINTGDNVTDVKIDYGKKRINLEAAVDALTSEPIPALNDMGYILLIPILGGIAVSRMRRDRRNSK